MSSELFFRGFFAAIASFAFACAVFFRYDGKVEAETSAEGEQKYLTIIHGAMLPTVLLTLILLALVFYGMAPSIKMALTMCFDIFLHISLYYPVLIMVLPFLRNRISARACARSGCCPTICI